MIYEVVKAMRTTHGGRFLIGYLIRDAQTGQEHLAVIKHGQLMGYVPLVDIVSHSRRC